MAGSSYQNLLGLLSGGRARGERRVSEGRLLGKAVVRTRGCRRVEADVAEIMKLRSLSPVFGRLEQVRCESGLLGSGLNERRTLPSTEWR